MRVAGPYLSKRQLLTPPKERCCIFQQRDEFLLDELNKLSSLCSLLFGVGGSGRPEWGYDLAGEGVDEEVNAGPGECAWWGWVLAICRGEGEAWYLQGFRNLGGGGIPLGLRGIG